MPDFDLADFVRDQRGCTREQILRAVDREVIRVSYKLQGYKRARARALGAEEYRRVLGAVKTLLSGGDRPPLTEEQLAAVRPLCR